MTFSQLSRLSGKLPFSWRKPRPAVLAAYSREPLWQRHRIVSLAVYAGLLALYGAIIGASGHFYMLQLTILPVMLAAMVIWALPDSKRPPTRLIATLTFAFLIALLAWPDYLALALPGLPWITAIRLVAIPLALIFLICLSTSGPFRGELLAALNATPLTWKLLLAFSFIAAFSIVISTNPSHSISRFLISQLYWVLIFFCAAWVFLRPGRTMLLAFLLWGFAIYVCAIGLLEWRMQTLPWAGRIPSFLAIEDPAVQRILAFKARAATGVYRIQSKFTTPLGLAEFLALMTPLVLYFMLYSRSTIIRLAALASLPLMLYTILLTDSRLGFVGFSMSFLLFLFAWAVMRWVRVRGSVFGPAVTLAYPTVFIGFIASTFLVGRVRALVWGTGAESFSTEARQEQIASGIPMIISRPWGHGIGRAAQELGFTNAEGTLTIDSYFLTIGLEFGIIGFLVYFGIFSAQLFYVARIIHKIKTLEQLLVIPLTISLMNFVIIKSIFSQQENHPLVFAILGVITALIFRINNEQEVTIPGDRLVFKSKMKEPVA